MKVKQHKGFNGIFFIDSKLATLNLTPGRRVYGEQLFTVDKKEYREWIPYRSKPAAAIKKGLKIFPLEAGMKILYLGIASGTTSSHFSDIIGRAGIIYGVEISERVLRDLVGVAEKRGNIIPILADARNVNSYENVVIEKVDMVYEDVADPTR